MSQGSDPAAADGIRAGDVVYLKSGGPAMVVSVLFDMDAPPGTTEKIPAAQCEWFSESHTVWLPTSYADGYALVCLTKKNPAG